MKKKCLFLLLIFCVLIVSCKKEMEPAMPQDAFELVLQDFNGDKEAVFSDINQWYTTNKRILVVFGYDFNFYPVMDNLKDYLASKYGLAEEDGLIYAVTFPEDFRHNGKYYSTDLFSFLNDSANDYCGIIILGAPENTHIALAKFQDLWGGKIPYPVIALFPQDDVLGLESTCDFIIEKKSNETVKNDSDLSEENSDFFEDAPFVLSNVIRYIIANESGFERDSNLLIHVNQALRHQSVHHYIDPETGIPSINHFVLN